MSTWHWPQWVYISIVVIKILINLAKDGERFSGKYSLSTSMLMSGIGIWILWMGGFWQ